MVASKRSQHLDQQHLDQILRRPGHSQVVALPAATLALSAGDLARWAVIVVAVAATVTLIVWFVTTRRHPEHAADHAESERIAARKPDGVARRPAGSSAVPPNASGAPD